MLFEPGPGRLAGHRAFRAGSASEDVDTEKSTAIDVCHPCAFVSFASTTTLNTLQYLHHLVNSSEYILQNAREKEKTVSNDSHFASCSTYAACMPTCAKRFLCQPVFPAFFSLAQTQDHRTCLPQARDDFLKRTLHPDQTPSGRTKTSKHTVNRHVMTLTCPPFSCPNHRHLRASPPQAQPSPPPHHPTSDPGSASIIARQSRRSPRLAATCKGERPAIRVGFRPRV